MKAFLLICSVLLFLGIAELPIGYYTFLRIIVTIGAITIIVRDSEKGINFWVVSFGVVAIIFNPLIPVYLHDKSMWIPIDVLAGVLFLVKLFTINKSEQK